MPQQILLRKGTAADWTASGSVVLAPGEPGVETDTGKLKIGNGISAWTLLNYTVPTNNNQLTNGANYIATTDTPYAGEYLTTDGTTASWAPVSALPSQAGNSGEYLTTDGTTAAWAPVSALPSQAGNSGEYLTTDGTESSWGTPGRVGYTSPAFVSADTYRFKIIAASTVGNLFTLSWNLLLQVPGFFGLASGGGPPPFLVGPPGPVWNRDYSNEVLFSPTADLAVGMLVRPNFFRPKQTTNASVVPGIDIQQVYYIKSIVNTTQVTLSLTPGGDTVVVPSDYVADEAAMAVMYDPVNGQPVVPWEASMIVCSVPTTTVGYDYPAVFVDFYLAAQSGFGCIQSSPIPAGQFGEGLAWETQFTMSPTVTTFSHIAISANTGLKYGGGPSARLLDVIMNHSAPGTKIYTMTSPYAQDRSANGAGWAENIPSNPYTMTLNADIFHASGGILLPLFTGGGNYAEQMGTINGLIGIPAGPGSCFALIDLSMYTRGQYTPQTNFTGIPDLVNGECFYVAKCTFSKTFGMPYGNMQGMFGGLLSGDFWPGLNGVVAPVFAAFDQDLTQPYFSEVTDAIADAVGANASAPVTWPVTNTAGNNGPVAIAIGIQAGLDSQGTRAVAIGAAAGEMYQGSDSVAIGYNAGNNAQQANAVAIGYYAGNYYQNSDSVAIGESAGQNSQGSHSVAIGTSAGNYYQSDNAVAIGYFAGHTQNSNAVAIGSGAGQNAQGSDSVAIGWNAGSYQDTNAVAVGSGAGQNSQGTNAVAIGYTAGLTSQGAGAVAIGALAGDDNQAVNSIILNATGSALNNAAANTFTVKPVRDGGAAAGMAAAGFKLTYYNPTTGEFVYASS